MNNGICKYHCDSTIPSYFCQCPLLLTSQQCSIVLHHPWLSTYKTGDSRNCSSLTSIICFFILSNPLLSPCKISGNSSSCCSQSSTIESSTIGLTEPLQPSLPPHKTGNSSNCGSQTLMICLAGPSQPCLTVYHTRPVPPATAGVKPQQSISPTLPSIQT